MKTNITITLERLDQPWERRVGEAFNRCISFAAELQPSCKAEDKNEIRPAFNRLVKNSEFTLADAKALADYAVTVAERVNKRAALHEKGASDVYKALGPSLRQASENLLTTLSDFLLEVKQAAHAAMKVV